MKNLRFFSRACALIVLTMSAVCVMAIPQRDHYSISAAGVYGYNTTWGHYGGAELRAELPINSYFLLYVNAEALSPNVYTVSANFQPRFELPTGELYLDGTLLAGIYERSRTCAYTMAASVGYRMDYVTAQVGFHSLISQDMDVHWHDESNFVVEPFNLLYKVDFRVRPHTSVWNLHFGMANFNEFQYERMWQPLFFLGAHYDLPFYNVGRASDDMHGNIRNLRLFCEATVKPAGMFHLAASFYGAKAKVGLAYRF